MDYNHEGHACKIDTWQKKLAVTVIAVGTTVIVYFIIQFAVIHVQDGAEVLPELEQEETLTRVPRALAKKDCGSKVTIDKFGNKKIVQDPECTPICSILPTLQRCRETKYWVDLCKRYPHMESCMEFCCNELAKVDWIDDGKIGIAYDYHPACDEVQIYYGTCHNNDELVKKGFRIPNKNWDTYRHGEVYEERMRRWLAGERKISKERMKEWLAAKGRIVRRRMR